MARTAVVVAMVLGGLAPIARADQCAWLDDEQVATRAAREIDRAKQIVSLCEPCGETVPGAPELAATVTTRAVDRGYREVVVNDRGIDLAYTYVKTTGDRYENLANLVGCPATGVSPSLAIEVPIGDPLHAAAPDRIGSAEPMPAPLPPVSAQPPVVREIDQDARTRWEASIGASFGTVALMQQSLGPMGLALTAGVRTHRLALVGDYRRLSIDWDPTGASDPVAARQGGAPSSAASGIMQRVGAAAEYYVLRLGTPAHDDILHDFFELFGEAGAGAEYLAWDGGGTLWRGDLAIGGGARLYGLRISDHRTVGLVIRVLEVYSRRGAHDMAPTCAGPCGVATPPTNWDRGTLASIALEITN